MRHYIVLYRDNKIMAPADAPFGFACQADDMDHAEEQCLNAYPGVDVVWIYQGKGKKAVDAAYKDYWNVANVLVKKGVK